jgi:hypothetical protein
MRKKNLYLVTVTILVVLSSVGGVLALLLQHEPTFYQRCHVPPSAERKELSDAFFRNAAQLWADVSKNRDGGRWRHAFTEAQINSFFEEGFLRLSEADEIHRHGVSGPRVQLEDNKIRLAFRYNLGPFSTLVSYDLRVWLVPREPNTIAVQILARRLGALPISAQGLLSEVADVARRHNLNFETTLYRHEGHPVVLVRYQADGPRPVSSLHCLKLSSASLTIGGGSMDGEPSSATTCPDGKCALTPPIITQRGAQAP